MLLAIDYSYTIKPNVILSIIGSGSRFHYLRSPTNSNTDLTHLRLACGLRYGNSLRRSFAVHALLHAAGPERYLFARSKLHHRS